MCLCLWARFAGTPPLLAGVCGVGVCLGLGFRLRPATPCWVVGFCVCLCARSACTPPLLAEVCDVGVCAWARVLAAPRHSWLGCLGVCVFVCELCLCPVTPGWALRCGCVCLGSGFGCAPPPLRGVLGCVCVCGRASLVPGHSWLGCAVWVRVLGFGFRLRPATPGWAVGGFVCLCARSACSPPLLAGLCGVGVCAWSRVLGSPRHSCPGCWVAFVFVGALRLYPATPGWGVRCGRGCLGSGFFCCASPLLARLLGCVCVCVRAPLVSRHSRLRCAVWVCVLGLRFRLRPATPGSGAGGLVCLCARSTCTPPLPPRLCGVGVCAWGRISGWLRHSWLGCWVLSVFVGALCLYPSTPGWGVWCGRGCVGSGFGCAPPLLAGVVGCVCVSVRAPLVLRHSWLGCAVWVCVLGLRFRLRPARPGWGVGLFLCLWGRSACTPPLLAGVCRVGVCFGLGSRLRPASPSWGVGVCVCLCARSACTTPLSAEVCGVGVGAWARVLAAPRLSWLGCWGMCAFVGALRLYPATPGWGLRCGCVCLHSGFGCAPPDLAQVLGCVCVCGRALLGPRHSWLECAVLVCALGWGFGCAPPLLAGVLGCVCVCVRALLVPRHSWLRCAVWVCVLELGIRLRPATPGWGVRCGRGCLGSGFGCAPPLLAGVLGYVCVCGRAPLVPRHSWLGFAVWMCVLALRFRLRPARLRSGVGVSLCLWARSAWPPPLLAGMCGIGVCLGLGFRLRPATPSWGVGLCVCLCARSACTPPLLAEVCGVGVCA